MSGRGSANGITVVKLGGSYADASDLREWVEAIAGCAGRIVLVPGGGPFAETVRDTQKEMGFDDQAAHRMALLAMEQYASALASLHQWLRLAPSVAVIRSVMRDGAVPVWSPLRMVLAAPDVPHTWDVTADSLAAWLARKLGAKRVVLVKRVDLNGKAVGSTELLARGVVDPAFPRFLKESGASAVILGPANVAALGAAVDGVPGAGTRITLP